MISTLKQLYLALDKLFSNISPVCANCQDDDCMGYSWLLPDEAKTLLAENIELLEINNNIMFINPYIAGEPIDIEKVKPRCPYYQNRLCQIRDLRPFVCRFYPLSFATENNTIYVVLHLDCAYSRNEEPNLRQSVAELFQQLSPSLLKEIINVYQQVDTITKFPDGHNRYIKLFVVKQSVDTKSAERR